ncbi:N-6 DNA methylase [Planktothrix agardhii 1029]|uniref:type ISP restriction/modification enzyme n=1 Tax=Planktothrix agardhii TaxID=1160 RepID=UPI001D09F03F|nr:type ISP restriction/modification enzyme [Planktothrix agardhii]MCB8765523.1 N-6 DNA methylase [Planktothrix agardhii 1809]MCB8783576.1 N-6 DNA methylase [Planktothrix agardhii 1808]MCF3565398.1 N-6 DNA methylase [Planktothrix agardhii 1807]MCF3592086.1 N-6 DNA methylase [Planktothrix agardhii 1029]MCF3621956.1 N-6 DNA methylase [Planktothrix agardhii 1030]
MIEKYIQNINKRYQLGNATEHTFRGDLQQLIENLVPTISATNEPKRQSCGAPDYILTKKDIPVGFIEAKDIGDKDLKGAKKTGNKEQFDRYKASLNNLIFTDYLDFHLYRDGEFITKIAIGEVTETGIKSLPENFLTFTNLIKDFCTHIGQTIKSPKKLAEMMAGKARLLSGVIEKALMSDEINQENSTLKDQMGAFKKILIHDITPKEFADVYAQTIAYGMFAARLHDPILETFSRQKAAELIPKSNPFLRKLFGYIAGPDIDDRIKWIVDNLVEIFLACNVEEILKNYGKSTKMEDPIIHFYETFLSEYDPKLRKARGVWYTPAPVVNFIVRAVDDILKTEFDLPQGLADNSKTKIKVDVQGKQVEQEVHKVQILDPAAGTGTFLAEVIKHIHNKFVGQQGIWSNYVETHLLPRLNGFELLMASYAMAHLQLDLLLTETGYKTTNNQRFRVYLTNSLEEKHPDTGTLFASWLSAEANEANYIKRDTPVMCVIGNPPYSGISSNNGEWINKLIEDYKYIDGVHFNERKHWLNDDYVKFLRYGQHFIEKNGSGVLAFINPHGFLDNPTFRGMRWNLLKTYDKIYTIDLHGNSKKKETAPDGNADVNVFDIMQGVSINIFVKTGKKKANELGKVFHFDLYGKREMKYDFLSDSSLKSVNFQELKPEKPFLFFVPKNNKGSKEYEKGFRVDELFSVNVTGVVTARDSFVIDFEKPILKKRMEEFSDINFTDDSIRRKFFGNKKEGKYLAGDSRGWKMVEARKTIQSFNHNDIIQKIAYRLFDDRYIYYHSSMVDWGREKFMYHFINKDNVGIDLCRQLVTDEYSHIFVTNKIVDDSFVSNKSRERGYVFPLYLYPDNPEQQIIIQTAERIPNLNTEIIKQIAEKLGLTFTNEKETTENTFAPIDILDYIYAVLHSLTYREKYKEFLKIDFPRVPYPKDQNTFWQLVKLGEEIRQIHLLESPTVEKYITQYPIDGDNIVTKPKYQDGKVYINNTQYFNFVPEIAWNFYIGGYQPAQKWLKDRKDRKLEIEDIFHYQKIIVALTETDRLMKEIDKIAIE